MVALMVVNRTAVLWMAVVKDAAHPEAASSAELMAHLAVAHHATVNFHSLDNPHPFLSTLPSSLISFANSRLLLRW
jgi:hypothetical protein